MRKILICGSTGFVGASLVDYFVRHGYDVSVLNRTPVQSSTHLRSYRWDVGGKQIDLRALQGVDTIINLTGTNISSKKWTQAQKEKIKRSRIDSTNLLYESLTECGSLPKLYISPSAVGYYGAKTSSEIFDESSQNGSDFLAEVCREWEDAAMRFKNLNTRVVIFRKGVVLGKDGGIYKKLSPLAKLGINTSLGSGNNYLPWIDMEDVIRLYNFAIQHKAMEGVFNMVGSQHITMKEFAETLASSLNKKLLTPPAPAFIIKMLFGEMASMLLKGSRVSNQKIIDQGYTFTKPDLLSSLFFLSNK